MGGTRSAESKTSRSIGTRRGRRRKKTASTEPSSKRSGATSKRIRTGERRRSPGTKYTAAPHTEVTTAASHSTRVEWVEMGTGRREEEEKNTMREEGGL
jgi:hypothetical protein